MKMRIRIYIKISHQQLTKLLPLNTKTLSTLLLSTRAYPKPTPP